MTNDFDLLEESLNYKFSNLSLLEEALSHPSLKHSDENRLISYERFEFLGDSILGFLVTEMIFNNFQDYDEGELSAIKSYIVSHDVLVKIAESLNLADYIIMHISEEGSGGRRNPNTLENALESLIAALYLDGGIEQTRRVINSLWLPYINNLDLEAANPKSALQELLQEQGYRKPIYKIIQRDGLAHSPIFTVQVEAKGQFETATGTTIKKAEKKAALKILRKLN